MEIGLQQLGKSLLMLNSQLAVVSNNIANTETDRYKGDDLSVTSFHEYFISEKYKAAKDRHYSIDTVIDHTQGELYKRNENDIAIKGQGFISVIFNDRQCYSRGGSLATDNNGYLIDQHGGYIQGDNGNIFVGNGSISVTEAGAVLSDGQQVGMIRIYDFTDYSNVFKIERDYYVSQENPGLAGGDSILKPGYSERSNVSLTKEYVKMMEISRKYETSHTVIQILDEINGKTVNGIATF